MRPSGSRVNYCLLLICLTSVYPNCCHGNNGVNSTSSTDCTQYSTAAQRDAACTDNTSSTIDNSTDNSTEGQAFTIDNSTEEQGEGSTQSPILTLMWAINNVINPLILLLGVGGNIATVVIMTSKSFRHLTISVLLIALACSDTGTLLMFPFNKPNFRAMMKTDARALSNTGCKVFFSCFRITKILSSWLLVLIAGERFISVWLYQQAKVISTRRNALLTISVLLVSISVYVCTWSSLTDTIISSTCIPNTRPPGREHRTRVFLFIGISLLCFLPAAIMLIINSLIGYKLHRAQVSTNQKSNDKVKATFMLYAVTLSFFILLLPISVAHLTFHAMDKNIFEVTSPAMVVFREVAQVMELLNASINFLLYTISSKTFRREIIKGLCPQVAARVMPEGTSSTTG